MLMKPTLIRFIKNNPEIKFDTNEINDIVSKIEKSFKMLKTFGPVEVNRLDKDGNLFIHFSDKIDDTDVELRLYFECLDETRFDDCGQLNIEVSERFRSKGDGYMSSISIVVPPSPVENYGHVSVYNWESVYNGAVCDIFVAFRTGFGYLK